MYGQCASVFEVRNVIQFLKDLTVQQTDKKVVGLVIVRDDAEQCRPPLRVPIDAFPDCPDVDVIVVKNVQDLRILKVSQPRMRGDDDRPDGILRTASNLQISNLCGMLIRQHVHHPVQLRKVAFLLRHLCLRQKVHHLAERGFLPLLRALIPDVGHNGLKIQRQRRIPERVIGMGSLRSGIVHQVRDQLDDVVVRTDVSKRVVAVRRIQVDQVELDNTGPG